MISRLTTVLAAAVLTTGCSSVPLGSVNALTSQRLESTRSLAAQLTASGLSAQQISDVLEQAAQHRPAAADPDFLKKVDEEMTHCDEMAKRLRINVNVSQTVRISIASVGIVAGSIIVPALAAKAAAAKSAMAAWGGVSGAANAAQLTLSDAGYSPLDTVRNQQAFIKALSDLEDTLPEITAESGEAGVYLLKLRRICRYQAFDASNFVEGAPTDHDKDH